MRRKVLAFVFAAAILVALAVPLFSGASSASAHAHFIILPDGSCQWLANGEEEPAGDHPIHINVHVGTPGTFGMDRPNNPVDIDKDSNYAARGCTPHP